MNLYIVEMLRWGDDESHHYIIGVYDNLVQAEQEGEKEKDWRGGKYEYKISFVKLNDNSKYTATLSLKS